MLPDGDHTVMLRGMQAVFGPGRTRRLAASLLLAVVLVAAGLAVGSDALEGVAEPRAPRFVGPGSWMPPAHAVASSRMRPTGLPAAPRSPDCSALTADRFVPSITEC